MERLSHDKRYQLVNRRFSIESRDGEVTDERELGSAAELGQVLDETFNVKPPNPVEEIFVRVGG
jgi:arylamine N-acetyltransferase